MINRRVWGDLNEDGGQRRQVAVADGQVRVDLDSRDVEQLVLDYHACVYRYAYRLTGHRGDAEDLTQQTFLIVQQKIGQLRDGAKVRAWLFTILRSCFLKSLRKRLPVPAASLELDVNEIPQHTTDVEIDQAVLQTAINELPEDFKLVVVMFYFEQCSYREIADKLHVPIGTVMSRLSRAKSRLRGKLLTAEASVT